jgi:ankyrin repeat protein
LGIGAAATFRVKSRAPKPMADARMRILSACALLLSMAASALAQVPPTADERARYGGLFAAAARNDAASVARLVAGGSAVDAVDGHGRTPLHVAAYSKAHDAMRALVGAGANPNALEHDRYDIVTIAAVADDVPTLEQALALGGSARNVTSRYDGTALIAAAHLGHDGVVAMLVRAGAPLDHVNNLGWTALIESIVLGDGGARHVATMKALIDGGADVNRPDRSGTTPLGLARARGFGAMIALLERAGAR